MTRSPPPAGTPGTPNAQQPPEHPRLRPPRRRADRGVVVRREDVLPQAPAAPARPDREVARRPARTRRRPRRAGRRRRPAADGAEAVHIGTEAAGGAETGG